jgi:hypothetical protein
MTEYFCNFMLQSVRHFFVADVMKRPECRPVFLGPNGGAEAIDGGIPPVYDSGFKRQLFFA